MVEPAVVVQKIVIGKQYAFSDKILFKIGLQKPEVSELVILALQRVSGFN